MYHPDRKSPYVRLFDKRPWTNDLFSCKFWRIHPATPQTSGHGCFLCRWFIESRKSSQKTMSAKVMEMGLWKWHGRKKTWWYLEALSIGSMGLVHLFIYYIYHRDQPFIWVKLPFVWILRGTGFPEVCWTCWQCVNIIRYSCDFSTLDLEGISTESPSPTPNTSTWRTGQMKKWSIANQKTGCISKKHV